MKDFTMKGPVRFACKRDAHPRKGQMNWWEDMGYYKSKTAKRQKLKKDIERGLDRATSAQRNMWFDSAR